MRTALSFGRRWCSNTQKVLLGWCPEHPSRAGRDTSREAWSSGANWGDILDFNIVYRYMLPRQHLRSNDSDRVIMTSSDQIFTIKVIFGWVFGIFKDFLWIRCWEFGAQFFTLFWAVCSLQHGRSTFFIWVIGNPRLSQTTIFSRQFTINMGQLWFTYKKLTIVWGSVP